MLTLPNKYLVEALIIILMWAVPVVFIIRPSHRNIYSMSDSHGLHLTWVPFADVY